jgi:hypothetical protein
LLQVKVAGNAGMRLLLLLLLLLLMAMEHSFATPFLSLPQRAAGLPLPKRLTVHGHWLSGGMKARSPPLHRTLSPRHA